MSIQVFVEGAKSADPTINSGSALQWLRSPCRKLCVKLNPSGQLRILAGLWPNLQAVHRLTGVFKLQLAQDNLPDKHPFSYARLVPIGRLLLQPVENGAARLQDVKTRFQRPIQAFLGSLKLIFTRRFTMGRGCTSFSWHTKPNYVGHTNQRWPRVCFGRLDGLIDGVNVQWVFHILDKPTISLKTLTGIFGKGHLGAAFDGDMIIIVKVINFPNFKLPAREAASAETPSIRSPSVTMP